MPLDVAMEEPNPRVIGPEPEYDIPVRADEDGIPAHGKLREGLVADVHARLILAAHDGLEGVPVQMERMFTWIHAVEDDFDNLVLLKHEWDGVGAIDSGVGSFEAGGEGRV